MASAYRYLNCMLSNIPAQNPYTRACICMFVCLCVCVCIYIHSYHNIVANVHSKDLNTLFSI